MIKLLTLAILLFSTGAFARDTAKWDQLVAAAKKEGKVVVIGPPDATVRKALPDAFKAKYGITVEYIGGRGTETSAKLRSERSAGVYSVDIAFGGSDSMATVYYAEKFIAPLKPELIDPEVTDPTKWKRSKLWFSDPEDTYVLRLFNTAGPIVFINTSQVKPGELKSVHDRSIRNGKVRFPHTIREFPAAGLARPPVFICNSGKTSFASSTSTSSRRSCATAAS